MTGLASVYTRQEFLAAGYGEGNAVTGIGGRNALRFKRVREVSKAFPVAAVGTSRAVPKVLRWVGGGIVRPFGAASVPGLMTQFFGAENEIGE